MGPERAQAIVSDPSCVSRHAFYPFISYVITTEKLSKSADQKALEKKEKNRPIAYSAHLDAHIYSYYSYMLSLQYEDFLKANDLQASILAFRPLGKSNIDFAKAAFDDIANRPDCTAIGMDISGFFDNLNHGILKTAWAKLIGNAELPDDHYSVFKSITKWSQVGRDALFTEFGISAHNPKGGRRRICSAEEFRRRVRQKGLITNNSTPYGIPQGSPISATLSNIYMMNFDVAIQAIAKKLAGTYFRYCDDILLILPNPTPEDIQEIVSSQIEAMKLCINPKKTEVRHFHMRPDGSIESDKPLQYLGFTFDGQRILIRSAAFARHSKKMKKAVRLAKSTRDRWNSIRYKNGESLKNVYKRALYEKYSHFGHQNFIRYGYKAAAVMKSKSIRGQLKALWPRLQKEIDRP